MERGHIYQTKIYAPYDGCHWTWEYCYYDGKKHYLHFGEQAKTNTFLASKLKDAFDFKTVPAGVYDTDLNTAEGRKELVTEVNAMHLSAIAKWIHDNTEFTLTATCPECGAECEVHEMHSTGYRGDGGVGIELLGYICSDCYASGVCDDCGEYDPSTRYIESEDKVCCEHCKPVSCAMCGKDMGDSENEVCSDCEDTPEYTAHLLKIELYLAMKRYQLFFPDCEQITAPVLKSA